MKRALLLSALAASPMFAQAADFGLGVSVQSNDAWIYAPIDITPAFRLEPSIRYFDGESESQARSLSVFRPVESTVTSDATTYELAIGAFGLAPIGESVRVYYGARVAYVDSDQQLRIVTDLGGFQDVSEEEFSSDGYRISPTLGFEYHLSKRFSIGGEAEWFYQDIDHERSGTDSDATNGSSKSSGTDTRLIVRFKF